LTGYRAGLKESKMSKKRVPLYLACLCVVAALPAQATASPVLTEGGSALKVGSTITGTSVGEVVGTLGPEEPPKYSLNCEQAHLHGEVVKNSGTEIEVTITSSTVNKQPEGTCGGLLRVTSANPPWCLRMTQAMVKETFELRGGKCTEAPKGPLTTTLYFGLYSCYYVKTSLAGSFRTQSEGDALLTTSKQKWEWELPSGIVCTSAWALDVSYTLETTNGTPLYIG
jgi:hypothetical protein